MSTVTTTAVAAPERPTAPTEPRRTFRAERISRNFLLGFTPRDYDGDAYRIMVEPLRIPQPDGRTSTRLGFPVLLLSGLTDEPGEVAAKFARILTDHYEATDTVTISQAEYDALTSERRHWRETAAIAICDLMRSAAGDHRLSLLGPKVARSAIMQQLEMWVSLLGDAVEGRVSPLCDACGKPVLPGDVCLSYSDVGSVHADCNHPRPGKLQAGQRVVITDGAWTDEDGREHTGPCVATLFEETALYTDEKIAQILAEGRAALGMEPQEPEGANA